jgi:hypothetical protein
MLDLFPFCLNVLNKHGKSFLVPEYLEHFGIVTPWVVQDNQSFICRNPDSPPHISVQLSAKTGRPQPKTLTGKHVGSFSQKYIAPETLILSGWRHHHIFMTSSPLNHAILLSHRGLSFMAVAQGGVVPPQEDLRGTEIGTGMVPKDGFFLTAVRITM